MTGAPERVSFQLKHSDQCTLWSTDREQWLTGPVLQRYDDRTIVRAGNYRFAHTVLTKHIQPVHDEGAPVVDINQLQEETALTLQVVGTERGAAYATAIAEAARMYRHLDTVRVVVSRNVFWTSDSDRRAQDAHALRGMVLVAVAILRATTRISRLDAANIAVHKDITDTADAFAKQDKERKPR